MRERMSEYVPESVPEQISHRISNRMSKHMPAILSNRMPECSAYIHICMIYVCRMPYIPPNDMSETVPEELFFSVGITRSSKYLSFTGAFWSNILGGHSWLLGKGALISLMLIVTTDHIH